MNTNVFPTQKATRIYAYTEPHLQETPWMGTRQGRGLLKVGYTTHDMDHKRVEENYPVKGPHGTPFLILIDEEAIKPDGTFFTDHPVHRVLVSMGVHRINGEWFGDGDARVPDLLPTAFVKSV